MSIYPSLSLIYLIVLLLQTPKTEARRKLNMDTAAAAGGSSSSLMGTVDPEGFKTPIKGGPKRRMGDFSSPSPKKITARSPLEKTRYETSLGLLTKKFVSLFHSAGSGTVDLNKASESLKVQKVSRIRNSFTYNDTHHLILQERWFKI